MSNENEIQSLKTEIGMLQTQLAHVNCEKVALDNSYGDQLHLTHQIRTQLAFAQAESKALQERAKAWDVEKAKLLEEIRTLKEGLAAEAA